MAADGRVKKQLPDFISTILKTDQTIAKEQLRFESAPEFKKDLRKSLQLLVQKEITSNLIPPQVRSIANNLSNMFL